jgi:hypothetical protein
VVLPLRGSPVNQTVTPRYVVGTARNGRRSRGRR